MYQLIKDKEEEEGEKEVKIKLTKCGFYVDLFAFSSFLSLFGMVTSILILIGSLEMIVVIRTHVFEIYYDELLICMLMLNIILNIIYLVMWTLLKMKTNNRNINDIERVTKVYCYVIASLEINVMIVLILYGVHILITSSENFLGIGIINVTNIGLCFAFLKIYGLMLYT